MFQAQTRRLRLTLCRPLRVDARRLFHGEPLRENPSLLLGEPYFLFLDGAAGRLLGKPCFLRQTLCLRPCRFLSLTDRFGRPLCLDPGLLREPALFGFPGPLARFERFEVEHLRLALERQQGHEPPIPRSQRRHRRELTCAGKQRLLPGIQLPALPGRPVRTSEHLRARRLGHDLKGGANRECTRHPQREHRRHLRRVEGRALREPTHAAHIREHLKRVCLRLRDSEPFERLLMKRAALSARPERIERGDVHPSSGEQRLRQRLVAEPDPRPHDVAGEQLQLRLATRREQRQPPGGLVFVSLVKRLGDGQSGHRSREPIPGFAESGIAALPGLEKGRRPALFSRQRSRFAARPRRRRSPPRCSSSSSSGPRAWGCSPRSRSHP